MTPERREFLLYAQAQRICRACRANWPWEGHHVVYQQEIRRLGGNIDDLRNAMRLCPGCHGNHHGRSKPILLTRLTDANYEFAFELMGARAGDYLRSKYSGEDPRLEEYERAAV